MGAAPIPKSATMSHIEENLDIFDFKLTEEEMNTLQTIGTGQRVVPIDEYVFWKKLDYFIQFCA